MSGARLYYATGVLALVGLFNYMDRYGISILVEPIKADLKLTDTEMGLLTGFAFSTTYALFGIPLARMADTRNRIKLLSVCLVIWSAATALMGAAANFFQMALARVFVGIGEAGGTPASNSIIGDYYPPETRARGLSLFTLGGTVGATLGLAIIGVMADTYGWRVTLIAMGLPGILVAVLLLLTVKEPSRGQFQAVEAPPNENWLDGVRTVLRARTMRHLLVAYAISSFGSTGIGAWLGAFLMRTHELTLTEVGSGVGLLVGVAALTGTLISAAFAPLLVKRDRRWELWWPSLAFGIAMPLYLVAFLADQVWLVFSLFALVNVIAYSSTGLIMTSVQSVLPGDARAMGIALIMFAAGLIGAGAGPLLVGYLSDIWTPTYGPDALRYALVIGVAFIAWGVVHFYLASRHLLDDLIS